MEHSYPVHSGVFEASQQARHWAALSNEASYCKLDIASANGVISDLACTWSALKKYNRIDRNDQEERLEFQYQ